MSLKKWYSLDPVPIGELFAELGTFGIRMSDPRLNRAKRRFKELNINVHDTKATVSQAQFKGAISPCVGLIAKSFRNQLIIPAFKSFTDLIEDMYKQCKPNNQGKVAGYIPQLATVDPKLWGVSVCTVDGQRYTVGDTDIPFTMQSCSKPLTYAIALQMLGQDVVHKYIGQEPSGRIFNDLVLDTNNKPHNPMINSGAIMTCALIKSLVKPNISSCEKFQYTSDWFKEMAGKERISFNNDVFLSERSVADRNFAIAYFMRENKCFPDNSDLQECLDFYFQCCSIETTCEPMSVIAATLANGGKCPLTNNQILRTDVVRDVLTLSASCGMYDYSGQYAFNVGLPAKSGVSGALIIIVPNVLGICTWSPPLDRYGNSCRGIQFSEQLVKTFNFHRYDNLCNINIKKDPRRHRDQIHIMLAHAEDGNLDELKQFKAEGMDFTMSDYDGRTALHFAAAGGHMECVKFLLEECGMPCCLTDRWGSSPHHEAQAFGHYDIAQYLRGIRSKESASNGVNRTGPPKKT